MISVPIASGGGIAAGVFTFTPPAGVKTQGFAALGAYSVAKLSTDAVGSFALTLTNLVVGSAVRIETQAGAEIAFRVAASADELFNVPAYVAGSPNNNLRIKVRKGTSAPFYKALDTLATALVGAQSIYIAQIPD